MMKIIGPPDRLFDDDVPLVMTNIVTLFYGKSSFSLGHLTINSPFSIVMLNYQRVTSKDITHQPHDVSCVRKRGLYHNLWQSVGILGDCVFRHSRRSDF